MKLNKYIFVFLFIGLFGCDTKSHIKEDYKPDYQIVTILAVDPPKRWRVDYVIDKTGEKRFARSKRCSSWKNLEVGKKYKVDVNRTNCDITLK